MWVFVYNQLHSCHTICLPTYLLFLPLPTQPQSKDSSASRMAQIDLGWSLRCHDEAQLAARIEAYVDTKEAIVAFKWCLDNREKRSPPLPDFPPEIRFMIDASLRDMAYQATRPWWLFARKCMLTSCCFEEHFTKDELANYEHDPFENKNDGFPREYRIRHLSVVDNYLASFKLPTSCDNHQEPWVRKFLNCRKVNMLTQRPFIYFFCGGYVKC